MDGVTTPLREVEILETGTHNGVAFTESDLDEMVANYAALSSYIKPPLKLGHDDAQVLAPQKDGDPALGWVAALRRQGTKLIATLTDVPQRLVDLIAKRRYRRVSSEVTLKFDQTGWEQNLKTGVKGRVLTGLALLGAELPAVASLNDLATLLATDTGKPLVIDGPLMEPVTFAVSASDSSMPLPRIALAVPDTKTCPNCGESMATDATSCPKCGAAMACKEKHANMATDDKAIKLSDLETKLAAMQAELDARTSKDADRDAELETLRTAAKQAEDRAALAAARQVALEADAYVDSVSNAECLKLTTPESKSLCRALFVTLSRTPAVEKDEAVLLKLSAEPTETPMLDVLKRFVASLPDQKVMLTQVAKSGAEKVPEGDDETISELSGIAEKHKLNLSNAADKAKAIRLYAASSPKDREKAKNLGVKVAGE